MPDVLGQNDRKVSVDWLTLPVELWLHILSFIPRTYFSRREVSCTCTKLYHVVLNIPNNSREMFFKEFHNRNKKIQRRYKVLEEHEYIEWLLSWFNDTQPSHQSLKSAWSTVRANELCFRLIVDLIDHFNSHYSDLYRHSLYYITQSGCNYVYYIWALDVAELLEADFVKFGKFVERDEGKDDLFSLTRSPCEIKTCQNREYSSVCYKMEVCEGRYVLRDLEKDQCRAEEHSHSNSIKYSWMGLYYQSKGGQEMYKILSLLSLTKEEVDEELMKEEVRDVYVFGMIDPEHQDHNSFTSIL